MNPEPKLRTGYCIFIDTVCEGSVPIWRDGKGNYVVYETEREAQKEIADDLMERLKQFLAGARDFEDAITVEDYIVPVTVKPDGTITDLEGNTFDPKQE